MKPESDLKKLSRLHWEVMFHHATRGARKPPGLTEMLEDLSCVENLCSIDFLLGRSSTRTRNSRHQRALIEGGTTEGDGTAI